jgi:hypothetical protein
MKQIETIDRKKTVLIINCKTIEDAKELCAFLDHQLDTAPQLAKGVKVLTQKEDRVIMELFDQQSAKRMQKLLKGFSKMPDAVIKRMFKI